MLHHGCFSCSISPISTDFEILFKKHHISLHDSPKSNFFLPCLSAGRGLNCDPLLVSAQGNGGACAEGSPEEDRGPGGCHGGATHPGQQVTSWARGPLGQQKRKTKSLNHPEQQVTHASRHGLESHGGSNNHQKNSHL